MFADGWATSPIGYTYFPRGGPGTLKIHLSRAAYNGAAPAGPGNDPRRHREAQRRGRPRPRPGARRAPRGCPEREARGGVGSRAFDSSHGDGGDVHVQGASRHAAARRPTRVRRSCPTTPGSAPPRRCAVSSGAVRIGVAKEIKSDEYRVALTPAGALELINGGHEVVVEAGAGAGSSFADAAYERVGARIAAVDEVWGSSDLLLKVKEPVAVEYGRLREGLTLFTYLHIAADEPLTRALVDSGVDRRRLRDGRDRGRGAAAARADVGGRGPARVAGRRVLPREAVRRARAAARRRAGRRARAGRDHRRRDRRLQRRDHRARARRAGDDPRALDRPDAPPRGDPLGPGDAPDVVEARDRRLRRATPTS